MAGKYIAFLQLNVSIPIGYIAKCAYYWPTCTASLQTSHPYTTLKYLHEFDVYTAGPHLGPADLMLCYVVLIFLHRFELLIWFWTSVPISTPANMDTRGSREAAQGSVYTHTHTLSLSLCAFFTLVYFIKIKSCNGSRYNDLQGSR